MTLIRDIRIRHQMPPLKTKRDKFLHVFYPALAGMVTSILLLYFLDLGSTFQKIITDLFSPIITGVVSGVILYILGLKR